MSAQMARIGHEESGYTLNRNLATIAATTTLALGVALGGATPAMAAERADDTSCWIDGVTGESLCVAVGEDLVEAVLDQKGVQISAPEGTIISGREYVQPIAARGGVTVLATVVGILYDDINAGGGSLVFTGVSSGCSGGYSYGYTDLGSVGWNDRASSMYGYAGCSTAIFENNNYTGAMLGYQSFASSFGALNDKASSWRLAY
ncbi:hypothetical protein ACWKWP_12350 [Agromyces soli]